MPKNKNTLTTRLSSHTSSEEIPQLPHGLNNKEGFYKSIKNIKSWLRQHEIQNATINADLSVDVKGDVHLRGWNLSRIPVKFGIISGDFDCSENQLTHLAFAPHTVGGDFKIYKNKITSLVGGPKKVSGFYNCKENNLKNLIGAPAILKEDFNCSKNELETLKGAPQKVGPTFNCNHNKLKSLEFCPKVVLIYMGCEYNQLETLEFLPEEMTEGYISLNDNPALLKHQNIDDIKVARIIQKEYLIKKEKSIIASIIKDNVDTDKDTNKTEDKKYKLHKI